MLTGKERAYLKGLAQNIDPLIQLGKDGINEGFLKQMDKLLEDHELVKIKVLQNAPVEVDEIVDEILEKTGAEFVQKIGKKLTIYRESKENKKIELP
ncbi:ribosome assembly RNA-binding protein YhbY [Peptoniphilus senegalensis]|uniref:ribosome assembly RNA-binding protein YhbY n=1 Tax=Peptoniphilus senegalensis TaxID=1465757 RepID=UPI0002E3E2E4|nr:ribosome assembly RNA-binding protein YhbY [Peptoniphilus senegalensis]